MNNVDSEYFRLLNTILDKGRVKHNRTGVDTLGVFGEQAKFDLSEGFPILTTKKVWFKGIVHELLWFIKGDTNIKYLVDNDVHIWDEWAYKRYTTWLNGQQTDGRFVGEEPWTMEEFIESIKQGDDLLFKDDKHPQSGQPLWKVCGELGEGTYGSMWRNFPAFDDTGARFCEDVEWHHVDQLQKVLDKLKDNPDDRRMIVSAWHPYWVDHCALPPCHCLFHFNTEELTLDERIELIKGEYQTNAGVVVPKHFAGTEHLDALNIPKRRLNLLLYQRSCDTFLGVPFNITSYSLLLAMVAHVSNMVPGVFTHTYGDLHIYSNHTEQIKEQMSREPKSLPQLHLNESVKDLFDFRFEDITLTDYFPHPPIKGAVAV
jgi:thymidylate synthase